ncbi:hypothetical protein LTR05_006991 [Lithohypha guttulata]|uniref:Ankyrin n=1 Tax=Lithohypha guttulata TaxID=1690604 RepID=A0AAN7YEZ3_9EURO|nr:hypothetical protein LTR05_006991 [Lithohypha guttulata]
MGQSDKWMFSSTIKITPSTVENGPGRLLVVRIRQVRSTHIVTTLPPTIQLRNIRPFGSEIFVIAAYGSVSELRRLLAAGEGLISDRNSEGWSLLAHALLTTNVPVVKFLLDNGADADACETMEGFDAPLQILSWVTPRYSKSAAERRLRSTDCVRLLMEGGADPSGLDPSSSMQATWVSYALMSASADVIRVMLDHGHPFFSPNAIYTSDEVPLLELASFHKCKAPDAYQIPDKVALLLSRGAAADTCNSNGNTCLHISMRYRTEEYALGRVFQNKIDKECDGELLDILMLLITAGANVHARNDFGESPSDIAHQWNHKREWTMALEECGYDSRSVIDAEEETVCWSSGHDFQGASFRRPLLTFAEYLRFRKLRHVEEVPYGWSQYRTNECEEYDSSRGEGSSRDEEGLIGEVGEDVWEAWETSSDVDGDDDSHGLLEDIELGREHAHTEVPVIENSDARVRDAQELQIAMLEAYRASKHKST